MMVYEKERVVMLEVLKLLKDRPCLWQRTHKHYVNKQMRLECYEELLEVYKKFDEDATTLILKKKLMNMRTNYIKELSKVLSKKKDATGEPYVPSLWYYDAFNFLHFLGRERIVRSALDAEYEANYSPDEDSVQETVHSVFIETCDNLDEPATFVTTSTTDSANTASSSRTIERNVSKGIKRPREEFNDTKSFSEEINSAEEAAFDTFGKSVSMQLKTMSVENALLAQSRIQSILSEIGITDYRQKTAEKLKKS